MMQLPPLSLYIHIPWCVQKCPYCDFNSHGIKAKTILADGSSPAMATIPESAYVQHLIQDLEADLKFVQNRPIQSIFFGGGTPSIFKPESIATILTEVRKRVTLVPDCEITLEANPGTIDQTKFDGFYQAGINRLSIGIQSFNPTHLQRLGRIHSQQQALSAVYFAKQAGFKKINVDLMHGLENQTVAQALDDLQQALALEPTHLSWYQLTIEPNTLFYYKPPALPDDDYLWEIETQGKALLQEHGFTQYEVSAYASDPTQQCQHNLHYWNFHDYLGIGCGAAGKLTTINGIFRTTKTKHPHGYLKGRHLDSITKVATKDLLFEYFLNRFRLFTPVNKLQFQQATGIDPRSVEQLLAKYFHNGAIVDTATSWELTELGHTYLNSILVDLIPATTDDK